MALSSWLGRWRWPFFTLFPFAATVLAHGVVLAGGLGRVCAGLLQSVCSCFASAGRGCLGCGPFGEATLYVVKACWLLCHPRSSQRYSFNKHCWLPSGPARCLAREGLPVAWLSKAGGHMLLTSFFRYSILFGIHSMLLKKFMYATRWVFSCWRRQSRTA